MRPFAVAAALQLAVPAVAGAVCDDAAAVAAARAAVHAACDCAGAARRADWVRCASNVLAAEVAAGRLTPGCRKEVRRCVTNSTCGRPGAVTCCRVTRGRVRCRIARSAAACRAPATPCAAASCCDACPQGTCAPATTTTTSSTTSTTRPCEETPYPDCAGGTCGGTGVCAPLAIFTNGMPHLICGCVDPTANCSGSFQDAMCPGVCQPDFVCYGEPDPGGLGNCVGCLPRELVELRP